MTRRTSAGIVSTGDILLIIAVGTLAAMVLLLWLAACINLVLTTAHKQTVEMLRILQHDSRTIDL